MDLMGCYYNILYLEVANKTSPNMPIPILAKIGKISKYISSPAPKANIKPIKNCIGIIDLLFIIRGIAIVKICVIHFYLSASYSNINKEAYIFLKAIVSNVL